ncbi:hypothetical protein WJX79_008233 [Trebouxia sp. C0005]
MAAGDKDTSGECFSKLNSRNHSTDAPNMNCNFKRALSILSLLNAPQPGSHLTRPKSVRQMEVPQKLYVRQLASADVQQPAFSSRTSAGQFWTAGRQDHREPLQFDAAAVLHDAQSLVEVVVPVGAPKLAKTAAPSLGC